MLVSENGTVDLVGALALGQTDRQRISEIFPGQGLPTYQPPAASIPEPLVIDPELHKKKPFFRLDNLWMWGLFGAAVLGAGFGVRALKG